jgi:hypothetical protein
LRKIPGLHAWEDQAIEDALNALRFLERQEERYDENQRGRALDTQGFRHPDAETAIHRTEDHEVRRFCFGIAFIGTGEETSLVRMRF